MLQIVINVNAPAAAAQAVKEAMAMQLERWGDAKVVQVVEVQPKAFQQKQPEAQQQRFC